MSWKDQLRRIKISMLNWQYWPWPVVYTPLLLQYFYHLIRFEGAGFPALINRPFMEVGGILEESKLYISQRIPSAWTPLTLTLEGITDSLQLREFMEENALNFPVIVKPDRGMRGKGVRIHRNENELLDHIKELDYLQTHIIQPYIDLPNEIGIFMIHAADGWHITSVMQKVLPSVVGDGQTCIKDLIRKDDQLFMQLPRFMRNDILDLTYVPRPGEEITLDHVGNHRLGTNFVDRTDLINEELSEAMSRVCEHLKGFEYGRLDIRYREYSELLQLENFSIIEVNGANSEPGHIYQKGFGLWEAWKVLLKHHRIIYHKARSARDAGQTAPDLRRSVSLFRQYLRTMKLS